MRISVYLKGQDPLHDETPHTASRDMAAGMVACCLVRPVGQNAVQIVNGMSWKELKSYFRGERVDATMTPHLLPPLDWYMPWTDLPEWLIRCYRHHELVTA